MYGGHRLGDNVYSDSLVAVGCETGQVRWYHQLVHHDLWDLDLNSAPMLLDATIAGKPIRTVVQLTKWGQAFVYDRATGAPVWPIEERPVPASDTPGERTAPIQPFPLKPAPYDVQSTDAEGLIDLTPELHAQALAMTQGFVTGPVYTPPPVEREGGSRGGLQSTSGGSSWAGGAFDPDTGMLYVPSYTRVVWASIVPGDPATTDLRYVRRRRALIDGPQGLPLTKPPFGRITAIDLTSGDTRWVVANADGPRDHPALKGTNPPPLGTSSHALPLLTKTLLFTALTDQATTQGRTADGKIPLAAYFDDSLKAYDKRSGALLASIKLPSGATGAPISYMYRGKQYVVVPIGSLRKTGGFVALALP
jgi:quinoprotein glucose dehydrogenase